MKVIFMGTPDFAVPSLDILIKSGYSVAAVFTQPDRPKGRGNKLQFPPVKQKAQEFHIPVFQPSTLRNSEVVQTIREIKPDVIVVVAYGHRLPKEILDIPKNGCINVHASLLPKYRGAAPIHWAIINGEEKTGVTTMFMEEGLDTGDMILKQEVMIGENETAGELHDRLAQIGAVALKGTLQQIEEGTYQRIQQDDTEATYAPLIKKELGKIQWSEPAEKIKNLIRGTNPWPTAYTTYLGKTVKIWKARVEQRSVTCTPGQIFEVRKDEIFVAAGKNVLVIQELQFSGGKRLSVREYLVGNTIKKNIIFGEEYGI